MYRELWGDVYRSNPVSVPGQEWEGIGRHLETRYSFLADKPTRQARYIWPSMRLVALPCTAVAIIRTLHSSTKQPGRALGARCQRAETRHPCFALIRVLYICI